VGHGVADPREIRLRADLLWENRFLYGQFLGKPSVSTMFCYPWYAAVHPLILYSGSTLHCSVRGDTVYFVLKWTALTALGAPPPPIRGTIA
jgi:hypothetical protein